jgi:hypothetical protein
MAFWRFDSMPKIRLACFCFFFYAAKKYNHVFTFALLSFATDQGLSIVFLSKYTIIDSKKRWSVAKAQGLDEYGLTLSTV